MCKCVKLIHIFGESKTGFDTNGNTLGATKVQDVTNIPSHIQEHENSTSKPLRQSKTQKQRQEQNYD